MGILSGLVWAFNKLTGRGVKRSRVTVAPQDGLDLDSSRREPHSARKRRRFTPPRGNKGLKGIGNENTSDNTNHTVIDLTQSHDNNSWPHRSHPVQVQQVPLKPHSPSHSQRATGPSSSSSELRSTSGAIVDPFTRIHQSSQFESIFSPTRTERPLVLGRRNARQYGNGEGPSCAAPPSPVLDSAPIASDTHTASVATRLSFSAQKPNSGTTTTTTTTTAAAAAAATVTTTFVATDEGVTITESAGPALPPTRRHSKRLRQSSSREHTGQEQGDRENNMSMSSTKKASTIDLTGEEDDDAVPVHGARTSTTATTTTTTTARAVPARAPLHASPRHTQFPTSPPRHRNSSAGGQGSNWQPSDIYTTTTHGYEQFKKQLDRKLAEAKQMEDELRQLQQQAAKLSFSPARLDRDLRERLRLQEEKDRAKTEKSAVARYCPSFRKLTKEEKQMVQDADDEPACIDEDFNTDIGKHELLLIRDHQWLNDKAINYYAGLCYHRGQSDPLLRETAPKCWLPGAHFLTLLSLQSGYDYKRVRRWTKRRKIDIFNPEQINKIICPVNISDTHWALCVINMDLKRIEYYDSMGKGLSETVFATVERYLVDEAKDKGKPEPNMKEWSRYMPKNTPQQRNGIDCGVFVCKFIDYILQDFEFDFSQDHMTYFRQRMVVELMTKQAWPPELE